MDNAFKFITESLFQSLNFTNYIYSIPQQFSNSILVQIFIFVSFQSLVFQRKERALDSSYKERKLALTSILAIKMIDVGVKGFHMVREVLYKCFFTLKLSKILDLSSRRFFYLGLIFRFLCGFWFLYPSMSLSMYLDYFQGVFSKNKRG